MALVQPWIEPEVNLVPGRRIRIGVDVSHGTPLYLDLSEDEVESYRWTVSYDFTWGQRNVTMIAIIETVSGDVFRVGAQTLPYPPWVRPVVGGKGRGKGVPAPAGIIGWMPAPAPAPPVVEEIPTDA